LEASSGTRGVRDLEFQERLGRVFELLTVPQPWKTQEHVRRHLDHGLVRRLRMIEHCIPTLAQLPPDGSPALSLYKVEEVNVALNALFLNLRGCLDNSALSEHDEELAVRLEAVAEWGRALSRPHWQRALARHILKGRQRSRRDRINMTRRAYAESN